MKRQSSAGDTKSFRIIKSKADHELLHKELAVLRNWMMKWKRKPSFADERIECWEKHLFMPINRLYIGYCHSVYGCWSLWFAPSETQTNPQQQAQRPENHEGLLGKFKETNVGHLQCTWMRQKRTKRFPKGCVCLCGGQVQQHQQIQRSKSTKLGPQAEADGRRRIALHMHCCLYSLPKDIFWLFPSMLQREPMATWTLPFQLWPT